MDEFMDEKYELRYLPLFYEDVFEKLSYIQNELHNPQAAADLLDETEKAILRRLPNCEDFEPYHSVKERSYPYYRIYVKNYIIFYVVIKDEGTKPIMEVRRFLYVGQDRDRIV